MDGIVSSLPVNANHSHQSGRMLSGFHQYSAGGERYANLAIFARIVYCWNRIF